MKTGFEIAVLIVGSWVAYSQIRDFMRARRTGVASVWLNDTPVSKSENPNLFALNTWSKLIAGVFMIICILWIAFH